MNISKKIYLNTEVDFPGKSRVFNSDHTVAVGSAPASLIAVMLNTFFHGKILQMDKKSLILKLDVFYFTGFRLI